MPLSLNQQLTSWDGKSKEQILAVYDQFSDRTDFVDQLCKSLKFIGMQQGASWLIKHSLEQGSQIPCLSTANAVLIYQHLQYAAHWQTKLHLLQSFLYLPMPPESILQIEGFLRGALIDPNKFVRAWAYNGFYLLCVNYPQYKEEVELLLKMGLRDEPASVKARIRNIVRNQK